MKDQQQLKSTWLELIPGFADDHIHVLPSLQHAVERLKTLDARPLQVLATGSLYLVGGLIEVAGLAGVAL